MRIMRHNHDPSGPRAAGHSDERAEKNGAPPEAQAGADSTPGECGQDTPQLSALGKSIAAILEEGERQVQLARREEEAARANADSPKPEEEQPPEPAIPDDALIAEAARAFADYKAGRITEEEGRERFGAAFAKFMEL